LQLAAPHDMQATPPAPHAFLVVPAAQLPCWVQHPAHVTESHTHWLFTQCLPLVQAVLVPHEQRPARQLSAVRRSHTVQVPPAVPHESTIAGLQVPFSQQPLGQLVAVHPPMHAPPSQLAPAMHVEQAPPVVPQALLAEPG
jgi:hypothetical protein